MAGLTTFHVTADTPNISPAYSLSGVTWQDTTIATRLRVVNKRLETALVPTYTKVYNVANAQNNNVLIYQLISDPLPAALWRAMDNITNTGPSVVSGCRMMQSVTTANASPLSTLYLATRQGVFKQSLLSSTTGTAMATTLTGRSFSNNSLGVFTTAAGDRFVHEIGIRVATSTTTGVVTVEFGSSVLTDWVNNSSTTPGDFRYEFNWDINRQDNMNYQVPSSVGMSMNLGR